MRIGGNVSANIAAYGKNKLEKTVESNFDNNFSRDNIESTIKNNEGLSPEKINKLAGQMYNVNYAKNKIVIDTQNNVEHYDVGPKYEPLDVKG